MNSEYATQNSIKLSPFLNTFINLREDKLILFDTKQQIQQEIKCQILNNNNINVLSTRKIERDNAVICRGEIYFKTAYNKVYKYQDQQLQLMNVKVSPAQSLFQMKDHLYIQVQANHISKLFVWSNNKLKHVYETEKPFQIYSWLDKILNITNQSISFLNDDYRFQLVYQTQNQIEPLFLCSGILVALSQQKQQVKTVIFIDLFSRNMQEVNINELGLQFVNQFDQYLELQRYGLQLKPQILEKYFGINFDQQCDEYYIQYLTDQMVRFPHFRNTVESLTNVKIHQIIQEKRCRQPPLILNCQLMFPLILQYGSQLFGAIEDDMLHIYNSERQILNTINVNLPKYAGYWVNVPHLHRPVICKGKVYIQCWTSNQVIEDCQLVQAPSLQANYILYSQDDELYAYTEQQRYYVLNNNKFKYLMEERQPYKQFYQFCNKIFVVQEGLISEFINGNTILLHKISGQQVSFAQGGTLIVHDNKIIWVMDMINGKLRKLIDDKRYNKHNILSLVRFGESGLQLKDELLVELFGEDFPSLIQKTYENYITDQYRRYPNLLVETDKLINTLAEDQKQFRYDTYQYLLENLKMKITQKILPCQLLFVQKLLPDVNIYLAVEDGFIHIFNDQKILLKQVAVNFDLFIGQQSRFFGESTQTHIYKMIMCSGRLYVHNNEYVYVLHNSQLQLITRVYGHRQNDWIFSFNNTLALFEDGVLYTLENGVRRDLQRFNSGMMIQFCKNTFLLAESSICFINADYSTEIIFEHQFRSLTKLFSHGGIAVIQFADVNWSPVFAVLDMVNRQVKMLNKEFDYQNVLLQVEVGEIGLQLPIKVQKQMLGEEFPGQAARMYTEYLQEQIQYREYAQELIHLLGDDLNILLQARFQRIDSQFEHIYDKYGQIHQQFEEKTHKHADVINVLCKRIISLTQDSSDIQ
ncbi:Conserved_hypothetical protein [Hexamita inflata]|uniref:Uncharacterized protein n=1 Tax=Hexamita inflata TaxID=28002 RepID=A0AA86TYY3_9EUKA|nr:Conserved hypothetical protein [Hexamita inflata]